MDWSPAYTPDTEACERSWVSTKLFEMDDVIHFELLFKLMGNHLLKIKH